MFSSSSTATLIASAGAPRTFTRVPNHFWTRLGIGYLLLGACAWLYAPNVGIRDWWVHGLWCGIGLAVACPVLWRMSLRGFDVVLTDHRMMFRASFAVYFLFGAALISIESARDGPGLSWYGISPAEALAVDAVNGLGFGIALLMAGITRGRWLGVQAGKAATLVAVVPRHWVVGLFLLLGVAASMYALPFDLGLREGFVPGIIRAAGKFALVAVILMSAARGRYEWGLRIGAAMLVVALVLVGILLFNKSEALLPIGALTAGLALRFRAGWVVPAGMALMVTGYTLLGSLSLYGRDEIGYLGAATMPERLQLLRAGWVITRDRSSEGEGFDGWGRLCYVPAQSAAMQFRDAGEGGDGLRLMWWVVVPRMLAPNKPEISKTGRELHAKMTGQATSSEGLGVFASGYYHGGWLGVLLASVLSGWVVAQTSAIARSIQLQRGLLLLPLSLLGLFIAFRIDGDFVSDYLGAFMLILLPLLAMSSFFVLAAPARSDRATGG